MKRFFMGVGVLIAVASNMFVQTANAQDVNNFTINAFDAEYHLSRDSEGRSVLKTKETITATFPQGNQNHGLERAIPLSYDGHATRVSIDSVKDVSGHELEYSESEWGDNRVLRIGDADVYVHGSQTYVLEYTQHDVTRFFSSTGADELYWDVNGAQWSQQIEQISAKVTIDESLKGALTGKTACYQGYEGSSEGCVKSQTGTVFTFSTGRVLQPNENLTFSIGFSPQTFAAYQQTAMEKFWAFLVILWIVLLIVTSLVAAGAIIWMVFIWRRVMNKEGKGSTVPEYLPPKGVSVLASAQVVKVPSSALTAQLLDFAVRHYVKIFQTKDKKLFRSAEYELEIVKDTTDLSQEEQSLIGVLFGRKRPSIGARFAMKSLQSNYTLGQQLTKNNKVLRDLMRGSYGYYEKAGHEARRLNKVATILLITGIVTLSPLAVIAAIVGYSCALGLWPLTQKGIDLRDYLAGLRLYIEVAEEERLRMLQSPEGAEKVGDIASNRGALVKLYERVLPYAALYGVEKEWMNQLGAYYDQASVQPDWYSGVNGTAFNAALFSASLSSFSDQSTSYSSSSSSASGGSDGSGSSGGGGGGGGGGGW